MLKVAAVPVSVLMLAAVDLRVGAIVVVPVRLVMTAYGDVIDDTADSKFVVMVDLQVKLP